MSQGVFPDIDPLETSGSELAALLNAFRDALLTAHSGSTAPSYAVATTFWLDTSATPWVYKIFDGADWMNVLDIDPTTNIVRLYHAGSVLGALATLSQISSEHISANAVTTAKIGDGQVTQAKLDASSVGGAQIKAAEAQSILSALLSANTLNYVLKGNGTGYTFGRPPVAVSGDDAAPDYLENKMAVGALLALETYDAGSGNKKARIKIANGTPNALLGFDGAGAPAVLTSGGVPAGVMMPYAGSTAPSGYLMCYGQAVSRTTYADLFVAIGVDYGAGNGTTTFNLPDARGRVMAGKDDMGGVAANRLTGASGGVDGTILGAAGGAETHTLTTSQMPSHTHGIIVQENSTSADTGIGSGVIGGSSFSRSTASNGSGWSHNNVQPTLVQNIIIKT